MKKIQSDRIQFWRPQGLSHNTQTLSLFLKKNSLSKNTARYRDIVYWSRDWRRRRRDETLEEELYSLSFLIESLNSNPQLIGAKDCFFIIYIYVKEKKRVGIFVICFGDNILISEIILFCWVLKKTLSLFNFQLWWVFPL